MTISQFLAFLGVVVLGTISPGPDFAVVLRHSAMSGRRCGLAAAAGVACGVLLWSGLAAIGLAGLLAASATAFTVVKLAGAGYLVYLGVRALLSARRGGYPVGVPGGGVSGAPRAFRQGLLGNVLNPKCAVFFVALLPQFLPVHPSLVDSALLAMVPVASSLLWFCLVAMIVGAMRLLLASTRIRRTIDAVTGGLLVALGVRLAAG